jgi:aspartate/methionine/tyrosine aminotransferase
LEPPPNLMHKQSEYMYWAKTCQSADYNLATSGVGAFPLNELPFDFARLEINGDNKYGYPPLKSAIAQKSGVDADCVVTAGGTSFANHLAMAAVLEPGDEVLIEQPAYGLLVDTALYFGARVNRFWRREEEDYAIDVAAVRRAMTPRTRLIVVTNLHNPSSVLTPEPVLRELAALAREAGARLLVDEVYLDAVYDDPPRTAFLLGPEVVVTSSLTKLYGLSGLRCGWILAEPDLARVMERLNDLFAAGGVYPGEVLSVVAFENLDRIRRRAQRVVEADRELLSAFLDEHRAELSAPPTQYGTTAFIRLLRGGVDAFAARLRSEFQTTVVPGRFFEMPEHFRVGMGVNTGMFREGLRRIGLALRA